MSPWTTSATGGGTKHTAVGRFDLGSHQIDLFTWAYQTSPNPVTACGGIDFYEGHEWYDNVMAIFDYDSPDGVTRGLLQVLTANGNGGFYESFSGEFGTLVISEVAKRADHVYREPIAHEWDQYAKCGLLLMPQQPAYKKTKTRDILIDIRVSPEPNKSMLPVVLNKPAHQPHLENFFDAIRNGTPLNCPAEMGYETAVAVLNQRSRRSRTYPPLRSPGVPRLKPSGTAPTTAGEHLRQRRLDNRGRHG